MAHPEEPPLDNFLKSFSKEALQIEIEAKRVEWNDAREKRKAECRASILNFLKNANPDLSGRIAFRLMDVCKNTGERENAELVRELRVFGVFNTIDTPGGHDIVCIELAHDNVRREGRAPSTLPRKVGTCKR